MNRVTGWLCRLLMQSSLYGRHCCIRHAKESCLIRGVQYCLVKEAYNVHVFGGNLFKKIRKINDFNNEMVIE